MHCALMYEDAFGTLVVVKVGFPESQRKGLY